MYKYKGKVYCKDCGEKLKLEIAMAADGQHNKLGDIAMNATDENWWPQQVESKAECESDTCVSSGGFEFLVRNTETLKVRVKAASEAAARSKLESMEFDAIERTYGLHLVDESMIVEKIQS